MQSLAIAIQTAVVAYLVLGAPVLGKYLYERLKLTRKSDPRARFRFYRGAFLMEWLQVGLVGVSILLEPQPLERLGLKQVAGLSPSATLALGGILLAVLVAMWLVARYVAPLRVHYERRLARLEDLIPATPGERVQFGALAITAGICEEFLFRGFLLFYVTQLVPGMPAAGLILTSAAVFGMAHAYQGWSGVLATGAMGGVMAFLYLQWGSLYPLMMLHAFSDLQALAASWGVQEAARGRGVIPRAEEGC
ncbi:MAG TPA: CPBP family intramembrane glutamic endopeptidase [Symbiobacteriaceae bacterium]|nr:CPBP family intramembrane glutamic endopeptidase [Symbiobacteriaceae bacterium]